MKPGDKFIVSSQIGNVILHRPDSNTAKIIAFVNGDVLVQIGETQHILPIDVFKQYIVESVSAEKKTTTQMADFSIFTLQDNQTTEPSSKDSSESDEQQENGETSNPEKQNSDSADKQDSAQQDDNPQNSSVATEDNSTQDDSQNSSGSNDNSGEDAQPDSNEDDLYGDDDLYDD